MAYIPDEQAALNVSLTKRVDEFDLDELAHPAAKAQVSEPVVPKAAKETVGRFHEAWAAESSHLSLAADVRGAIEKQLEKVPLAAV